MGITEIAKYTNLKGCPHTFGHLVFQWFQLHITLTVNLIFSTVYWAIVVFIISHDTFYLLGLASIAQCAYQSSKSHPPCPVDMSSVCPASRAASRQTGITVPSAGKTCHQTSNPLYLKPSSEFRNGLQHPPFTILPNLPFLKRAFVFTPSHSTKFIQIVVERSLWMWQMIFSSVSVSVKRPAFPVNGLTPVLWQTPVLSQVSPAAACRDQGLL